VDSDADSGTWLRASVPVQLPAASHEPIRVLVADDHTWCARAWSTCSTPAASARSWRRRRTGWPRWKRAQDAARRRHRRHLDARLNGIEVVRRPARRVAETRTLVLTMHEDEEYVLHVVRAGAVRLPAQGQPDQRADQRGEGSCMPGSAHFGAAAARVLANQVQKPEGAAPTPTGA
jgi:DNA-binding NarL/FixJ family response regulator